MTYQKFDTTNPSSTSPYVEGRLDHIEEGIAALATGAVQVIATQP